jgi:hypothetical protein
LFFMNLLIGIKINVASSFMLIMVLTLIPLAHIYIKRKGLYERLPFKRWRDGKEREETQSAIRKPG